jgi:hypothetical protein
MDSAPWQLRATNASLDSGSLSAALDLARPAHGLTIAGREAWGRFLAATLSEAEGPLGQPPSAVQDAYVRGHDLVATYDETRARPFRVALYWRALEGQAAPGALLGVELIVSVQTSLLESRPALDVRSELAADELFALDERGALVGHETTEGRPLEKAAAACSLARLSDAATSYVQMLHPATVAESHVERRSGGRLWLDHRLFFPADLEKGVILRARLRGIFLPRPGDSDALDHVAAADNAVMVAAGSRRQPRSGVPCSART